MSGTLLTVLHRKRLEFSYLGGGASQTITLIPEIALCNYGYVAIYARVHERSMTSGQSLAFNLYNTLPTPHDAREFIEMDASGNLVPFLTLTLTSAAPFSAPGFSYHSTTGQGPFAKLTLIATQTSVSSTFYAELSAEILLRETR